MAEFPVDQSRRQLQQVCPAWDMVHQSSDDGCPLLRCHKHGLSVWHGCQLSVKADAEELNKVSYLDLFPVNHDGHVVISLAQSAASLAGLATSVAGLATSVAWSAVSVAWSAKSVAVSGTWLAKLVRSRIGRE
jgi:hypothetical protein